MVVVYNFLSCRGSSGCVDADQIDGPRGLPDPVCVSPNPANSIEIYRNSAELRYPSTEAVKDIQIWGESVCVCSQGLLQLDSFSLAVKPPSSPPLSLSLPIPSSASPEMLPLRWHYIYRKHPFYCSSCYYCWCCDFSIVLYLVNLLLLSDSGWMGNVTVVFFIW